MLDNMVARLLNAYDNASAADMAAGHAWYDTARLTAAALAAGTNLSVRHAAGVIAALSPRVRWENNVEGAALIIAAVAHHTNEPIVAGYYRNRKKAWDIAQGADPDTILGGPKVTAFFANIMGDEDRVTVDVWAARAAEGKTDPRGPEGKRYNAIADAYRMAARARDVSPMVMQATVWMYTRRTFGRADQMEMGF
jgi:hypothetical protein